MFLCWGWQGGLTTSIQNHRSCYFTGAAIKIYCMNKRRHWYVKSSKFPVTCIIMLFMQYIVIAVPVKWRLLCFWILVVRPPCTYRHTTAQTAQLLNTACACPHGAIRSPQMLLAEESWYFVRYACRVRVWRTSNYLVVLTWQLHDMSYHV